MEREGKEDGKRSKGRLKEKERKMGREVKEDEKEKKRKMGREGKEDERKKNGGKLDQMKNEEGGGW